MNAHNIRGYLAAVLIGAAMVAGVLLACPAKASPEQDYQYFALLERQGLTVTNRTQAKATAYSVCNALAAGTNWRPILRQLMSGDLDLDSAATVFATAVTVYCPELEPDLDNEPDTAGHIT